MNDTNKPDHESARGIATRVLDRQQGMDPGRECLARAYLASQVLLQKSDLSLTGCMEEVEILRDRLAASEAKTAQLRDKWVRAVAESEKYREEGKWKDG